MKIYVPLETDTAETRTPLTPGSAEKLVNLGATLEFQSGIGITIRQPDSAYTDQGAVVATDPDKSLREADMVLRLGPPSEEDVGKMKAGTINVSYLDPFRRLGLIRKLAESNISAISMEMIPRTTIAQKMDAISSQASLGGYVAVILAAERLDRILPMMMTPSGTIAPTKVFIIGVGVAGLQAIATAKRMGARVEAFDTRPVVEEQVKSLGARFVKVDLGETGQTKDGYAKALTEDQLALQREAMARHCANADIVITTAQVFGRKAPLIVTAEMVAGMKPGSVIVDMAVDTGGNVDGSVLNEEVEVNGVKIIGQANLPGQVPVPASEMYANNLANMLEHFWDKEQGAFVLKQDDEIIQGSLITHAGNICNEILKALANEGEKQ